MHEFDTEVHGDEVDAMCMSLAKFRIHKGVVAGWGRQHTSVRRFALITGLARAAITLARGSSVVHVCRVPQPNDAILRASDSEPAARIKGRLHMSSC